MALSENTKVVLTLTNTALIVLAVIGFVWGAASFTKEIEKDIEINKISIKSNTSGIDLNKKNIENNEDDIDDIQIDIAKIYTELVGVTDRQIRMLDILENR